MPYTLGDVNCEDGGWALKVLCAVLPLRLRFRKKMQSVTCDEQQAVKKKEGESLLRKYSACGVAMMSVFR